MTPKRKAELRALDEVGKMSWERRAGDALDAIPELLAEVEWLEGLKEVSDKGYRVLMADFVATKARVVEVEAMVEAVREYCGEPNNGPFRDGRRWADDISALIPRGKEELE